MSAPALAESVSSRQAAPRRARRICLVTEAAGGGVGRHFLDLAAGLAGRGVEVVAIYSPGRVDESFRERRARLRGISFLELPMRRAVHPLDALDLKRLTNLIHSEGPFDVIHGHSSKGGALARLAARWLGLPSVYTPHAFVTLDPALSRFKRQLYARIERWLARHSSAVIAVSEDEAAHARELGIESHQIHVVHNGIEPLALAPRDDVRARLGIAPHDLVIGFVGRLVPQKGPELLLRALPLVLQRRPQVKLLIVGDGPLGPGMRREVEQQGLASRVLLLGDQLAAPLMPAFDIFCLPSRYEGMPYVLLEALAAGLPLVASRVGGVTTCVEEGHNGLVVPVADESRLAEALVLLAGDAQLRQRFSAASAAKAAHFSATQMAEQTLALYEHVLEHVRAR